MEPSEGTTWKKIMDAAGERIPKSKILDLLLEHLGESVQDAANAIENNNLGAAARNVGQAQGEIERVQEVWQSIKLV